MKKQSKDEPPQIKKTKKGKDDLTYPPFEDIYRQSEELQDLDPDNLMHLKTPNEKPGAKNEKDFNEARSGSDLDTNDAKADELDVPNVDDEENDIYSLGGDKHD